MVIKRRGAVLAVVSLMLCVAVYLNWSYGRDDEAQIVISDGIDTSKTLGEATYVDLNMETQTAESTNNNSDYFSKARLSRQQSRDEAINILKQTTDSEKATKEDKEKAAAEISELAANAVKESRIESLVKAKGYDECVALISDTGISVIIPASENGLTAADAAKIKDIAASETKLGAEKIKIIETAK